MPIILNKKFRFLNSPSSHYEILYMNFKLTFEIE